MNKKRAEFIYKLPGTIKVRTLTKTSSQAKYANQPYYKLTITQGQQPNKTLQVFENKLTNPLIWTTLQSAQHGELSKKKFIFHCQNIKGYYHLINWEELN